MPQPICKLRGFLKGREARVRLDEDFLCKVLCISRIFCFHGWPVQFGWDEVAVQHHVNVITLEEWLKSHLGFDPQVVISVQNWLMTPQQLLLEVTEGAAFYDPDGDLRRVRSKLQWYPDDIWMWLLACQWRRIAQEKAFIGRTSEVDDEIGAQESSRLESYAISYVSVFL